jgi:O-antigen/teichoic acid export membrane protein
VAALLRERAVQIRQLASLAPRAIRSKGLASIADQGVISAGNFLTGVVLARSLDQSQFGVWVLGTLVIYFALSMQNGLMSTPLTINGAALDLASFRRNLRANLVLHLVFTVASCACIAVVALVWEPLRPVFVPLVLTAGLWEFQEFCRRVLYTRLQVWSALINNAVNYDLQAVLLAIVVLSIGMTLQLAFWLVAATSLLAALLGCWQLRPFLTRHGDDPWVVGRANFRIGRWSSASALLSAAGYQWYPALLAILDNVASAAVLGVFSQLLGPVNLLVRPLQSYYQPLAVRSLAERGRAGLNSVLAKATLVIGPAYAAYMLVVALAPGLFLRLVYGGTYVAYQDTLRLFALVNLVFIPGQLLGVELAARRMQRVLFWGEMSSVLVVYTVGLALIARLGVLGVVFSTAISGSVQLVLYTAIVLRTRQRERAGVTSTLAQSRAYRHRGLLLPDRARHAPDKLDDAPPVGVGVEVG